MTISTQSIQSVCSEALPQQPGVRHNKGRGDSTGASKPASPVAATADREVPAKKKNAADDEVPAKKYAAVCNGTGTKPAELMDPISPAKLVSIVHDQLPPLLSMIIDGLPPIHQSQYVHEAENRMHDYVKHHQNAIFLDSYCRVGLSCASYLHAGAISLDRLVAIAIQYTLIFLVDDLFFDDPSELLQDGYGISHNVCRSPEKIQEYLDHLNAVFGQQVQQSNPAPLIETMMWEIGRDMLELSNPEWFGNFVACVVEHHCTTVASHADIVSGDNLCFQDLESYAAMRAGNVGGKFAQLFVEFATNSYIPSTWKVTPYMQNISIAASIHLGFVNDIFSYHKESSLEQNPRNVISVLMACEGEPFVETVHMAIGLVNAYARTIIDLSGEAWNSSLQKYLQEIKALIAGNVYFSSMDKRYRHPDSFFPELRDMTSSWKIVPDA